MPNLSVKWDRGKENQIVPSEDNMGKLLTLKGKSKLYVIPCLSEQKPFGGINKYFLQSRGCDDQL